MRVLTYDKSENSFLGLAWKSGAILYASRFDLVVPATTWLEALTALRKLQRITEWHHWGHGTAGEVLINREKLNRAACQEGHPLHQSLLAVAAALTPESLVWFRVCSAFTGVPGQRFAEDIVKTLGCRVASSTFLIGMPFHSGQRSLRPNQLPYWPSGEGIEVGTPARPQKIAQSRANAPNTIPFYRQHLPATW